MSNSITSGVDIHSLFAQYTAKQSTLQPAQVHARQSMTDTATVSLSMSVATAANQPVDILTVARPAYINEIRVEQADANTAPDPAIGNVVQLHGRKADTTKSARSCPAGVKVGDIDSESRTLLGYISEDFVMVTGEGPVVAYHIETGCRLSKEGLKHYCTKEYGYVLRAVEVKGGSLEWKQFPAGDIWWDWNDPQRRVPLYLVMEPTSLPEHADNPKVFNCWHVLKHTMSVPDGCATPNDIQILTNHLLYLSDGDKVGATYFLCWLAWLYQHPEAKIPTAITLYSKHTRVGKNMVGRLIAKVFGPPLVVTDGSERLLTGRFDDATKHKRIVIINEVRLCGKDRAAFEEFKNKISAETVVFEGKGTPAREVRNTQHYIITTNHEDALPLAEDEGRIAVLRCLAERQPDNYYVELGAWIDGPGAPALANVLATWVFPKGWDYRAPVPKTEAAKDMHHDSRGHAINFLQDRIAARDGCFARQIGRCQAIYNQLSGNAMYTKLVDAYGIKPETLPRMLATLGYKQIFKPTKEGKPSSNPNTKVWCWANPEWWDQQPVAAWNDYITNGIAPEGMPPFGDGDDE